MVTLALWKGMIAVRTSSWLAGIGTKRIYPVGRKSSQYPEFYLNLLHPHKYNSNALGEVYRGYAL